MKEDPVKVVAEETAGEGADLVIDLSGAPQAIVQGIGMLARDGRFCALGLTHGEVSLDWTGLVLKAARVQFSFSSDYRSWEWCLSMIGDGLIKLDRYTDHLFPLERWEEAFDLARSGDALKVIIQPCRKERTENTIKKKERTS
jgi:threonine dehydrogenase-like Zn-dependent dehydrogenase